MSVFNLSIDQLIQTEDTVFLNGQTLIALTMISVDNYFRELMFGHSAGLSLHDSSKAELPRQSCIRSGLKQVWNAIPRTNKHEEMLQLLSIFRGFGRGWQAAQRDTSRNSTKACVALYCVQPEREAKRFSAFHVVAVCGKPQQRRHMFFSKPGASEPIA